MTQHNFVSVEKLTRTQFTIYKYKYIYSAHTIQSTRQQLKCYVVQYPSALYSNGLTGVLISSIAWDEALENSISKWKRGGSVVCS